jgi:hypothetical protein
MGPLLSTQDIANYTDLSERKVRHILAHFRNTSDVDAVEIIFYRQTFIGNAHEKC